MAPGLPVASVHGPYEDFGIKIVEYLIELEKGKPKDVKEELWRIYLEDLKGWREFLKGLVGKS